MSGECSIAFCILTATATGSLTVHFFPLLRPLFLFAIFFFAPSHCLAFILVSQALVERQAKDIEGLRTELAEAKQELKASAAAATRCSGENTGLQEELATAASELATLRQMETQLKRSLEDKEALYQRLYEHAEGLEQELEDNERAMREKELQLGETKKSLRAAQARTEELEAELMEAQGAAARLQQATALVSAVWRWKGLGGGSPASLLLSEQGIGNGIAWCE